MGEFEASYRELYVYALRAARRVVGDGETARDIASETLARAYVRWRQVEGHAPAWVTRVAANLAIEIVRRKPTPTMSLLPSGGEPTPDRVVLATELVRLPRRQREALVLRFLLDLDEAETAAILGVTAGTVHTHVARGLARIRHLIPPETALGAEVP